MFEQLFNWVILKIGKLKIIVKPPVGFEPARVLGLRNTCTI